MTLFFCCQAFRIPLYFHFCHFNWYILAWICLGSSHRTPVIPIPRYLFPSVGLRSFQPQVLQLHFDSFFLLSSGILCSGGWHTLHYLVGLTCHFLFFLSFVFLSTDWVPCVNFQMTYLFRYVDLVCCLLALAWFLSQQLRCLILVSLWFLAPVTVICLFINSLSGDL